MVSKVGEVNRWPSRKRVSGLYQEPPWKCRHPQVSFRNRGRLKVAFSLAIPDGFFPGWVYPGDIQFCDLTRRTVGQAVSQSEHRGFVFGFWLYKTTQRTWFKRKKKKAKTRRALSSLSTLGWRRVWRSHLSPSLTLWSSYMTRPVTIPRVTNWFPMTWGFLALALEIAHPANLLSAGQAQTAGHLNCISVFYL